METRSSQAEWKKGSAELLILSLVEARPRHGYEISKLIEQRSGGAVRFHVASLPAALPIGTPWLAVWTLDRKGWTSPPPLLSSDPSGPQGARFSTSWMARICCRNQ